MALVMFGDLDEIDVTTEADLEDEESGVEDEGDDRDGP